MNWLSLLFLLFLLLCLNFSSFSFPFPFILPLLLFLFFFQFLSLLQFLCLPFLFLFLFLFHSLQGFFLHFLCFRGFGYMHSRGDKRNHRLTAHSSHSFDASSTLSGFTILQDKWLALFSRLGLFLLWLPGVLDNFLNLDFLFRLLLDLWFRLLLFGRFFAENIVVLVIIIKQRFLGWFSLFGISSYFRYWRQRHRNLLWRLSNRILDNFFLNYRLNFGLYLGFFLFANWRNKWSGLFLEADRRSLSSRDLLLE